MDDPATELAFDEDQQTEEEKKVIDFMYDALDRCDSDALMVLPRDLLSWLCKELELPYSGTKGMMVERLTKHRGCWTKLRSFAKIVKKFPIKTAVALAFFYYADQYAGKYSSYSQIGLPSNGYVRDELHIHGRFLSCGLDSSPELCVLKEISAITAEKISHDISRVFSWF